MSEPVVRRLARTKPTHESEDEDEYEIGQSSTFQQQVPGKFRARVKQYAQQAQFPQMPAYAVDEVVYLQIPGQSQPAGPFVVVKIEHDGKYKLKRQDNSQEHPEAVTEDRLLVPAG